MNKNIPLSCTSSNRYIANELNWKEIEKSLSAKLHLFTREIVFFAHSDSVMQDCSKLLKSNNLIFRTFNSFNSALRIGVDRTADVIVITDEFDAASNSNFTKLLKNRACQELQVITWNNSSVKELVSCIQNSIASINQIENKKLVIDRIVESRASSNRQKQNEGIITENKSILSEKDFRNILKKELDDSVNDDPEKILAKAIQVIKELK